MPAWLVPPSGNVLGRIRSVPCSIRVGIRRPRQRRYLLEFAWTKIVRHQMVHGSASPDDLALATYWAPASAPGRGQCRPLGETWL